LCVSAPELFSRTTVGVAVGLAVALVVGVIVISRVLDEPVAVAPPPTTTPAPVPRTGPLALVPVAAPDAGSAECGTLLGALPVALTSGSSRLRRLTLAEPAPPATMAWAADRGEPVVLRCGLPRPVELTPTARLTEVSGVRWLPVTGAGASTWYLVDRAVYVALTLPDGAGTGPVQEISETVGRVLG
jgi:hypothetical protein